MKLHGKRALAFLISLTTVLCLTCGAAWAANTDASAQLMAAKSGSCGKNLKWSLNSKGTLTISGKGAMYDYADKTDPDVNSPWYAHNKSIKKITIKSGATSIGAGAFTDCKATSVSIPKTVTKIGNYAFQNASVKSVTVPNSVKTIGESAFYGSGVTTVKLPNKLTKISDGLFGDSKLTSITIPDGVTSIGQAAFFRTDIKKVALPAKVKSIDHIAFDECKKLTKISFSGDAPDISQEYTFDGVIAKVYYPAGNKTWTAKKLAEYNKIKKESSGKLTWKLWNPYTTSLSSVKGGKKMITVKWKKNKQVTGYEIQYAASKSFKSAKSKKVKGAATVSKTVKGLKAKKRYYVRVRTYKTASGQTYTSGWSKVKTVKTK